MSANWKRRSDIALVLIDCENLTGRHQVAAGFRWRAFARIETFGRACHLARWRLALAGFGRIPDTEVAIADDAPPQAADQAIARRVDALLESRPDFVAIASNDSDFDPDISRLNDAGIPAARHSDPGPAELLALVVVDLAGPDGWADVGPVGERLSHEFDVSLRGRLVPLANKAGLKIRRNVKGRIQLTSLHADLSKP